MRWATFVPGAGLLGAFIAELILHPVLYPAYAGIPLFVQALRSSQMSTAAQAHVHFEQRGRGFDEASYIESFLVLNLLGGDYPEDSERLREDAGLKQMPGHSVEGVPDQV